MVTPRRRSAVGRRRCPACRRTSMSPAGTPPCTSGARRRRATAGGTSGGRPCAPGGDPAEPTTTTNRTTSSATMPPTTSDAAPRARDRRGDARGRIPRNAHCAAATTAEEAAASHPRRRPREGAPRAPRAAPHRVASNAERRRVAPPAPSSRDAAVRAALARPVRLSAVLRDNPTCFDPNKLRISVVDKRLSSVDEVPPAYRPTQRLYMSHNNVKQLAGLAQFRELRLLSAGDNPVDDIPQLDALARGCPHLEAVSLELCPVAKLPFYRAHVIARLPRLKSLDGVVVSRHESDTAPRLVRKDVGHLEMLMNAAVTADKLRRAYRLAKVHEELTKVVYAPNGPVEPCSLPGPNEGSAPLDPRLYLRLCAPERTMTSGELAALARRLRGAAAAEAPTARRTQRGRSPSRPRFPRWTSPRCGRRRTRR